MLHFWDVRIPAFGGRFASVSLLHIILHLNYIIFKFGQRPICEKTKQIFGNVGSERVMIMMVMIVYYFQKTKKQ